MTGILDGEDSLYEMTMISSICSHCKNYNVEDVEGHTCKAFPNGIPPEIWLGKNPHTHPFKGDNGVQFERIE
jgi:hypothetical protein